MFPHERSLVEKLKNEPFALIGVNSDKDKEKVRPDLVKNGVTWRSFWCGEKGTSGAIPTAWNVRAWPTLYFIDAEGIIRHKNVRDEAQMEKVLDEMIAEAKKSAASQGR